MSRGVFAPLLLLLLFALLLVNTRAFLFPQRPTDTNNGNKRLLLIAMEKRTDKPDMGAIATGSILGGMALGPLGIPLGAAIGDALSSSKKEEAKKGHVFSERPLQRRPEAGEKKREIKEKSEGGVYTRPLGGGRRGEIHKRRQETA
jgi:hypothetical protein